MQSVLSPEAVRSFSRNLFPKTYFSLLAKTRPSVPSNDNFICIEDHKFSRISRYEWYGRARTEEIELRAVNWQSMRAGRLSKRIIANIRRRIQRQFSSVCDARRTSLSTRVFRNIRFPPLLVLLLLVAFLSYISSPRVLSPLRQSSLRETRRVSPRSAWVSDTRDWRKASRRHRLRNSRHRESPNGSLDEHRLRACLDRAESLLGGWPEGG